jgi:hypothetical protein
MERIAVIMLAAQAHDCLEGAKRQATVLTAPALATVEAVLDNVVAWLNGEPRTDTDWSLALLHEFVDMYAVGTDWH